MVRESFKKDNLMANKNLSLLTKIIKTSVTNELNKIKITDIQPDIGSIQNNTYSINKTAYLKDINIYKGVYYSRYFEWYGEAREAFFTKCIIFDFMDDFDYAIATKHASCNYHGEISPFDTLTITVNTSNIKRASSELIFKIFNSQNELVADGSQTVLLLDENGKIVKAPKFIQDRMKLFYTDKQTIIIKPFEIIEKSK